MDPVADNLVRVLDGWSDTESGTLIRAQSLSGLWDQRHLGAIPHDPDGIDRLIHRVRSNAFFQANAGGLEHGMFVPGGGIQTEGDLYDFFTA